MIRAMAEMLGCEDCKMIRMVKWTSDSEKPEEVHCVPQQVVKNLMRGNGVGGVFFRKEKVEECDNAARFSPK